MGESVVSCSHSSDVLLHSIRRGRLIRRLDGVEAHTVCLSSEGVVMTWNESQHTFSTFTLNGTPIASAQLSFFCSIGCMEISVDGTSALIGINSLENGRAYNSSTPGLRIYSNYQRIPRILGIILNHRIICEIW